MLSEDETDKVLAGDTTEGTHDLLDRWLTRSWERITSHFPWLWLQESINLSWPGASSGSPSVLYLPHFVYRLISLQSPDQSGSEWPVQFGYYGVQADVASTGTITATSSAGAADNDLQVRIEGLDANDYDLIETITLAGAGTATTTGSFKGGAGGVRRVSLVPSTTSYTGAVTITDAGGTTIERLDASREREHQHIRTELYAQTSGASTFKVRFQRRPFNVTAASDIIPIPFEFVDLMELSMMMELYRFRADWTGYNITKMEYTERMKEFRSWNNRNVGQVRSVSPRRMWGGRNPWR